MKVTKSHHVDCSERDAQGFYDYYYEYDIYTFSDDRTSLIARRYFDDSDAHFLRVEEDGKRRTLEPGDFASPLCREAMDFLKKEGLGRLQYLGPDGYVDFDSENQKRRAEQGG